MLHIHRHVTGLRRFRPVVIAQKTEGDWQVDDLRIVPRSPWRFLSRARERYAGGGPWQITVGEARRVIREAGDAGVLHVFFGNVAVHLLPLLRRSPMPVIVSFHGSDVAGSMASPEYARAVREVFHLAAAVPCRSQQLADQVAKLGCPVSKIRIMRTILPELEFHRREMPADGAWHIIQAARLVPKKGLVTAMKAFAAFSETYPKATFTIAGAGPMEEELRGLAGELGLGERVRLTGFLSQDGLRRAFESSHIFLHPSETAAGDVEGIPNAMLEAMASGLPVVATRHGGIPEVITDGVDGQLCEERDVAGVAEALLRLAGDAELYARLAKAGSDAVREQFSAGRQIAAIEEIYLAAMRDFAG